MLFRSSAVLAVAYRPVLDVLCSGRALHPEDAELAQRSSGWLNLAYEALIQGDQDNVERCLQMASAFVDENEGARDPSSPA